MKFHRILKYYTGTYSHACMHDIATYPFIIEISNTIVYWEEDPQTHSYMALRWWVLVGNYAILTSSAILEYFLGILKLAPWPICNIFWALVEEGQPSLCILGEVTLRLCSHYLPLTQNDAIIIFLVTELHGERY